MIFTGGFSWLTNLFHDEEQGVTISVERSMPSPTVSDSAEKPTSGAFGPNVERQKITESDKMSAIDASNVNGGGCGIDGWVYFRPPDDFRKKSRIPYPDYKTAADADGSRLYATTELKGDASVQVTELYVKVLKRNPMPDPHRATIVILNSGILCLVEPDDSTVYASVSLDSPGNMKRAAVEINTIERTGKQTLGLPLVLEKGDFLNFSIAISADKCACSWVPVVKWKLDGVAHLTEIRNNGNPFRTVPSDGLQAVEFRPAYDDDGDISKWKIHSG
ncbi:hypothetical protein [Streptomyces phaeochromogenes]|uniref:hypothetical protein n=1 Tax=Streptomyces phaeochromogenes TaxID=1923 RepID=UPI002DD79E1D|nr:hypothetical protein [Streptomyces phaeochromogenes]WRZ31947.1 hypothetical protein OG931_31530 [Streptomyces phaeochromogenes]